MTSTGQKRTGRMLRLLAMRGCILLFFRVTRCIGRPDGKIMTELKTGHWFAIKKGFLVMERWVNVPAVLNAIPLRNGQGFGERAVITMRVNLKIVWVDR